MVQQLRNFQFFAGITVTPDFFNLDAGVYGFTMSGTSWGTATFNRVMPDGSTLVQVAQFSSNGYTELHLPAGQYQMALSGVTLTGLVELIAPGSR